MIAKRAVQRIWIGMRKRTMTPHILNVAAIMREPGRVVVLFPFDQVSREKLIADPSWIVKAFPRQEVCLVSMPDEQLREFARKEGFRNFTPQKMELNWFDFPSRAYLNRIRNLKAKVLIDLEQDRNCFNAAVCAISDIPVRIGSALSWGLPIHNVQIKAGGTEDRTRHIFSLLDVVSTLNSSLATS